MFGRQSLRIVIVLGILVTLVGGTGIFAVFTDRATTGDNVVNSGSRPSAADLQINGGIETAAGIDCEQDVDGDGLLFEDDLTTGLFAINSIQPGDATAAAFVCLKNVGSGLLSLTASVIDLIDTESACSGDEAAAGDTTCGLDANGVPQAGELGAVIAIQANHVACATGAATGLQSNSLANWVGNPVAIPGTIAQNQLSCLRFDVFYPSTTPEASIQVAQSDHVAWRFAFDGTAQ